MKQAIYFFCLLSLLYSCHGGNMREGVKAGPDTVDALMGDSSTNKSKPKIDTAAAALPTDTAPYKRKSDSLVDSRLKKDTDSSGNKIKKVHK